MREEQKVLRLMQRLGNLPARNRELVETFLEEERAKGKSAATIRKYLEFLLWAGNRVDFESATKREIIKLVGEIEASGKSAWTKSKERSMLKKFYKWLRGYEDSYPPEVSWVKTGVPKNKRFLPEDILTVEEVEKLIDVSPNLRTKALIATLYDTGCRASELLFMRVKDVSFDEYSAIVVLHGKTGSRRCRAIFATPYLKQWLESHPRKEEIESPLWVHNRVPSRRLTYEGLRSLLKFLQKRAGLKKKLHPHLFRHSRATHLANVLKEAQMKEYFGWTRDSKMPAVYVHLSGRDVDDALLDFYKLKKKEEEKNRPKRCPVCGELNSPGAELCWRCYRPLDGMETASVKDLIKELIAMELSGERDEKKLLELLEKLK